MNILIYNIGEFYPNKGGVERISCNLAQEFIDRGNKVVFLIKKKNFNINQDTLCKMISLETEDFSDDDIKLRISNILDECKIDVVLSQDSYDLQFIKFMKKNFIVPVVSVHHGKPLPDIFELKRTKVKGENISFNKIMKKVLIRYRYKRRLKGNIKNVKDMIDYSAKLVLLSNNFKKDIMRNINIDEDKVTSISNFTRFNNITSDENLKKRKTVLFVGRLLSQKEPIRLILVWEKLYKKYPDWNLRIAGDGAYKDNLIKYIDKYNIKNVDILGTVDPIEEYKKASILCMTSTYEGFGLVLIEASVFGCVPMAFDSFSSVHDIIENGKNGILVQPFDLKKYQKELEKFMSDENYRKQLQKETLKVNEKFDKDKIVDQWIKLFEDLIKRGNK
ncbi:MAG: glycosyltransferase [Clostridia bacterium]